MPISFLIIGVVMASKEILFRDAENALLDSYGVNAFNLRAMEDYLPKKAFKAMKDTIEKGKPLPFGIEDDVAKGMTEWAISKGATHYTHWFLPLTGTTAEKHDSFINPKGSSGAVLSFKGSQLIQGEPDASSFPSGGLRATFEARGYTAWDPTSPAFLKYMNEGPTLCIPTAFASYTGEALDKKTPLLRSMEALSTSVRRFIKVFDGSVGETKAFATLGVEQEYFLVDREIYLARPDLIQMGRTLFGRTPAKHQQMDDHYFGSIKRRVLAFMNDVDRECWKLGIPAKTRHNEVSPAQFEIAPVFEELNLSVDHNMMLMQILKETAESHGLVALLHEKPFAGVNGSGKHNNWSLSDPSGNNMLEPGNSPHENAKFLAVLGAIIRGVDKYSRLLRSVVASAGNDHRLGANEAPPAIISIFLGDQLTDIIEQIEKGSASTSKAKDVMKLGVTSLPDLPKDVTDRNRTSPFAFTGNKFEFRAVGSAQSCAGPNVVLNTIVAESLDEITDVLEKAGSKTEMNELLHKQLTYIVKKHKRILFNGDNYSKEWALEAEKRGLPNIKSTYDALSAIISKESVELFTKYRVLSETELKSRYNIYTESYETIVSMEGECALNMVKTMYLPSVCDHLRSLAETINSMKHLGDTKSLKALSENLKFISSLTADAYDGASKLEKALAKGKPKEILKEMSALRASIDALEGEVDDALWPVPKYKDLLFVY